MHENTIKNIEVYSQIKDGPVWNPVTQRLVYNSIIKHVDFYTASVIDLGCGKGDFLDYLYLKTLDDKYLTSYTGYDLMPEFIEECRHKLSNKNYNFKAGNLFHTKFPQTDIIMALASLEIIEPYESRFDHINAVLNLFGRMWQAAEHFVIIATQSSYADIKDNSHYFDSHSFVRRCVEKVGCRNFILDHSYSPHFFTFIACKDKTSWEKLDAGELSALGEVK